MTDKEVTITIRNSPPGMRRQLKIIAAQQEISVRDLLIGIIEHYISEQIDQEIRDRR